MNDKKKHFFSVCLVLSSEGSARHTEKDLKMAVKRRIQAKRKIKRQLGLDDLLSFIPNVPTPRSILRQLLQGLFGRIFNRPKPVVKKEYNFSSKKDRQLYSQHVVDAYYQACYATTAQSTLAVLGEVIFSTPIVSSALAQGWRITRGAVGSFNRLVVRLNHGEVFAKAQQQNQPVINQVIRDSKKHRKDYDLNIANPAPYLRDARTEGYWRYIVTNAWRHQQKQLQKIFDKQAKILFRQKR